MKCPHCSKDIKDGLVLSEAAKIQGKRAGRSDGGGVRCKKHGVFIKNGVCKRCEAEKVKQLRRDNARTTDKY